MLSGQQTVFGGHSPSQAGQNDWSQAIRAGSQRQKPALLTK
jgi:hypothetical protein